MKTKIIYISGNEVFDMADIRAAFEEVRNTLHLGSDTVMFGVPVDNDDAFAGAVKTDDVAPVQVVETAPEIDDDVAPVITSVAAADVVPEPETVPMKKSTKRGRAKNKVTQPVVDATPVDTDENADTQKIIPILSVLGGKSESASDNATEISDTKSDTVDEITDESATDIPDIDISAEFDSVSVAADGDDTPHAEIVDMITDDAPEAPIEKTLEQLLESMTPLREDTVEDIVPTTSDENVSPDIDLNDLVADDTIDNAGDGDATLEKLAAEFAENQDKIPETPKPESHSKIGKLKNILPFKKAKREDTGIMGDLFGWAGIAANDDDFSIPGFFTQAASSKK